MNTAKLTWYAARSGGIVAWCLLALSLVVGLVLSSRVFGRRVSPAWTLSVHRFLGGLGVIFTAIHVVAIMLDDFVDFGFAEVFLPWASAWRPGAVAWGIVAMYLMLAIELTSFAMKRLPKRLWRGVHWLSGPLFVVATLHGYQAGTDTGRAFVLGTLVAIALLAALTAVRVIRWRRAGSRDDVRDLVRSAKGRPQMRAEPPAHLLDRLTLTSRPPPAPALLPASSLAEALPVVPDSAASLRRGSVDRFCAALEESGATIQDPGAVPALPTTPPAAPVMPAPAAVPVAAMPPTPPRAPVAVPASAITPPAPPRPPWEREPETTERRPGPAPGVWKRSTPVG